MLSEGTGEVEVDAVVEEVDVLEEVFVESVVGEIVLSTFMKN
jgi:hypothetical protein